MKKYPLLIILAVSAVVIVLCGFALPSTVRNSLLPDSYITSFLIDLHSGDLFKPHSIPASVPNPAQSPTGDGASPSPYITAPGQATDTVLPTPTASAPPSASPSATPSSPPSAPPTPSGTISAPPASLPAGAGFTQVDRNYFNDALFVGDSRMVGIQEYSGLDNATYYASVGLTVYGLLDNPFITLSGHSKPVTLDYALQQKQFGKIYIMVGINEMGTGSQQRFIDTYKAAIQRIQELQPKAIIYIQGILYVTASRSDTDEIVNNNNIRERNRRLSELADGKRTFYIDVNGVFMDGGGNLNKDYSWDNCHLQAKYYYMWTDFLMKYGIVQADAKKQ